MASELTNIQILRSAVPHKRPDPSFLLDGQLALNYKDDDPGLFAKLQNGGMFKIGPSAYTVNEVAPNQNPGVGGVAGNLVGEEWIDGRGAFFAPIKKFWNGASWVPCNGFLVNDTTGDLTCLKTLTVGVLEADAVIVDGPIVGNGDILPNGTSCLFDIGGLNERWGFVYCCGIDLDGSLSLSGTLDVAGVGTFGNNVSINNDLFVNGGATFGTDCGSNRFTVKSPSYFNCDMEILGDVEARSLNLTTDLRVEGSTTLGTGAGDTVNVIGDVIFHNNATFRGFPLLFDSIEISLTSTLKGDVFIGTTCGSGDNLTVNSPSTFNCVNDFEGNVNIGLVSQAALRTWGANIFDKDIQTNANLNVAGKGYSAMTVDADPDNTMVTKKWVIDKINALIAAHSH